MRRGSLVLTAVSLQWVLGTPAGEAQRGRGSGLSSRRPRTHIQPSGDGAHALKNPAPHPPPAPARPPPSHAGLRDCRPAGALMGQGRARWLEDSEHWRVWWVSRARAASKAHALFFLCPACGLPPPDRLLDLD